MGGHTMQRKSAHEPDFEPDVICLLDALQKLIREVFFRRIYGGGGLWTRVVFCLTLAYAFPY
jgi:hypothetical protein